MVWGKSLRFLYHHKFSIVSSFISEHITKTYIDLSKAQSKAFLTFQVISVVKQIHNLYIVDNFQYLFNKANQTPSITTDYYKLFILFEKDLNCDPKTDHLFPKNILPLFDQQIDQIFFQSNKISQFLIKQIQNKKETGDFTKELQENQFKICELQDKLKKQQENQKQLEIYYQNQQEQYIKERNNLKLQVENYKEQMYGYKMASMLFKPDFQENNNQNQNNQGGKIQQLMDQLQKQENINKSLKIKLKNAQNQIQEQEKQINEIKVTQYNFNNQIKQNKIENQEQIIKIDVGIQCNVDNDEKQIQTDEIKEQKIEDTSLKVTKQQTIEQEIIQRVKIEVEKQNNLVLRNRKALRNNDQALQQMEEEQKKQLQKIEQLETENKVYKNQNQTLCVDVYEKGEQIQIYQNQILSLEQKLKKKQKKNNNIEQNDDKNININNQNEEQQQQLKQNNKNQNIQIKETLIKQSYQDNFTQTDIEDKIQKDIQIKENQINQETEQSNIEINEDHLKMQNTPIQQLIDEYVQTNDINKTLYNLLQLNFETDQQKFLNINALTLNQCDQIKLYIDQIKKGFQVPQLLQQNNIINQQDIELELIDELQQNIQQIKDNQKNFQQQADQFHDCGQSFDLQGNIIHIKTMDVIYNNLKFKHQRYTTFFDALYKSVHGIDCFEKLHNAKIQMQRVGIELKNRELEQQMFKQRSNISIIKNGDFKAQLKLKIGDGYKINGGKRMILMDQK